MRSTAICQRGVGICGPVLVACRLACAGKRLGSFNAFGAYGQEIFVNPDRELVVVFTSDLPSDQAETILEELIRDYVLPALPQ